VARLDLRYRRDGGTGDTRIGVYGSTNGVAWERMGAPLETSSDNWQSQAYDAGSYPNLPQYKYFRFDNSSTGAAARVENIYITEAWSESTPDEAFTTGATNWIAPRGGWQWNAGGQNYGRKGYLGPLIGFEMQSRTTNTPFSEYEWTTHAAYAVSNLSYVSTYVPINFWESRFTRVKHTSGLSSLVIDDLGSSSWRDTPWTNISGWSGQEVWIAQATNAAGVTNWFVELWRGRADTNRSQFIMTPYLTSGVDTISFDYKVQNGPARVEVRRSSDVDTNNFTSVITNVSLATTSGGTQHVPIKSTDSMFIRIVHTNGPNTNTILTVDNVRIKDYKPRDAYTWYAYNALITYTNDVREFEPDYSPEEDVRTCYLNNSPTADTPPTEPGLYDYEPFVQSAYLANGIGEISLWYRRWTAGSGSGEIYLRGSTNSEAPTSAWTDLGSIAPIQNAQYVYFRTNVWQPNLRYLRIYATTNPAVDRVCLDNVLVTEALRSDFVITNVAVVPEVPLHTNDVRVRAKLMHFVNFPSNFQVRAYYQVGTNQWGNWPTNKYLVLLDGDADNVYESSGVITNLPIDTVVQYYVAALWDGMLTPKAWTNAKTHRAFINPSWYEPVDLNKGQAYTNPYYFVFSCSTGVVWFNEVNIKDWSAIVSTQYIELAGAAGADISSWLVQVVDGTETLKATYTAPTPTVFANETNGFGFWVLGTNSLPAADMYLTNTLDQTDGLGLRLVRSMGAHEEKISVGQWDACLTLRGRGYEWAGYDAGGPSSRYQALIRTNTQPGVLRYDFAWNVSTNGQWSPGFANPGQLLGGVAASLEIAIINFWLANGSNWIVFTASPGPVVSPTPWYRTNLMRGDRSFRRRRGTGRT